MEKRKSWFKIPSPSKSSLAFLSTKASSAAIERDFSPVSDVVTRKRSSLKPWLVEILLGLKLNADVLPLEFSKIPVLTKDDVKVFHRKKQAKANENGERVLAGKCAKAPANPDLILEAGVIPDNEILVGNSVESIQEEDIAHGGLRPGPEVASPTGSSS